MLKLTHHGIDETKAHTRTRDVRWSDFRTRNWVTTTQVWSWNQGKCDAIVVPGDGRSTYAVVRVDKKVDVVECSNGGLRSVMATLGFDPTNYKVVASGN